MKKVILFSVVVLLAFTGRSQVSFGVHAGGHLASLTSKYDGKEQGGKKSVFGFKIGGIASIPVSDNISFMPELNFTTKGGQFKVEEKEILPGGLGSITTVADEENNFSFIEVPLNIAFIASSEDGSGFFGGAGPVISFGMGGKSEGTATVTTMITGLPTQTSSSVYKADVKFDGKKDATDENAHLKGFEFGGNIFAGYRLSNGLFAKAYYHMGFSNLSPEDKTTVKTSYFGIGVGFLFGSK